MDVGGPLIHYVEDGVGEPLVLLHGLGFSLYTWRHNRDALAERHRVLALDLPGCGYSTLPRVRPASCEAMAGYLKVFLDNLAIDRAALCGAGEGGVYALELACRCPDRVRALILCSPGSLTRQFPLPVRLLASQRLGPLALRLMRREHVERHLLWCYFNEIDVDRTMVRQVHQPLENPETATALLRLLQAYDDSYVHERLRGLAIPTLLLWGENDHGRPSVLAEEYRSQMPDARVRLLRNCGMLPHEEKPKDFNAAALEFLAQTRRHEEGFDDGLLTDRFD